LKSVWSWHFEVDDSCCSRVIPFLRRFASYPYHRLDCYRTWQWVKGHRVFFKKQEVFTIQEHMSSPRVLLGFVLLVILVFCVVLLFYLSSFYVLLHVSLDCPFLFVVLSNVYHPVALKIHPLFSSPTFTAPVRVYYVWMQHEYRLST